MYWAFLVNSYWLATVGIIKFRDGICCVTLSCDLDLMECARLRSLNKSQKIDGRGGAIWNSNGKVFTRRVHYMGHGS